MLCNLTDKKQHSPTFLLLTVVCDSVAGQLCTGLCAVLILLVMLVFRWTTGRSRSLAFPLQPLGLFLGPSSLLIQLQSPARLLLQLCHPDTHLARLLAVTEGPLILQGSERLPIRLITIRGEAEGS
ncbi:hypothetical protein JZ751_027764 [Albula glossodonta]|uniref:Uncharacterized protein n=1 Tax=Albula glossodonta TaxID=121402 RepID=A0A8T2PDR0_9TELE|nr:hypothetical protein JZ751_027764 [Albula glossodonta]